ncbi:AraC family transcriptional regulator [Cohnella cellulosilytica]|uniref:AraC family transcriptional regulator n=1 Tax=Cohnella cellulosilytica TaxID=986710 RepID=A0ABW2FI33_9BACL
MTPSSIQLQSAGYSVHRKFIRFRKGITSALLIRLQVKGNAQAIIDDRLLEVGTGDLIVSRPGQTYQLIIDAMPNRESADFYLFCEGDWTERWLERCRIADGKVRIEAREDILFLWRRLIEEQRNLHEDNEELKEHLLKALCLTLERAANERTTDASRSEVYLPYRIKRYIEQHATEALTLGQIAEHHSVSVSSAVHLFKRTFSKSIIRYALEVRLSVAAERIVHTELPLEEISDTCGFRSYPYFCRAFRSRYQIPPSSYRTRYRAT